ncbi:MAG: hypothetical protein PXY39_02165 [archaeon]|nr:hypothetical protein [archaeon]
MQLEQKLLALDKERQYLLCQTEDFRNFRSEAMSVITKIPVELWEKTGGVRHFGLKWNYAQEPHWENWHNAIEHLSDREVRITIPTFYQESDPSHPKVMILNVLITPWINDALRQAWSKEKEIECSRLPNTRTDSITNCVIAMSGYARGTARNPVFIAKGRIRNALVPLQRFLNLICNLISSKLCTLFHYRPQLGLEEKTDLAPAWDIIYEGHRRRIIPTFVSTLQRNAGLLIEEAGVYLSKPLRQTLISLHKIVATFKQISERLAGQDPVYYDIENRDLSQSNRLFMQFGAKSLEEMDWNASHPLFLKEIELIDRSKFEDPVIAKYAELNEELKTLEQMKRKITQIWERPRPAEERYLNDPQTKWEDFASGRRRERSGPQDCFTLKRYDKFIATVRNQMLQIEAAWKKAQEAGDQPV